MYVGTNVGFFLYLRSNNNASCQLRGVAGAACARKRNVLCVFIVQPQPNARFLVLEVRPAAVGRLRAVVKPVLRVVQQVQPTLLRVPRHRKDRKTETQRALSGMWATGDAQRWQQARTFVSSGVG
jgi:hypothetical protein